MSKSKKTATLQTQATRRVWSNPWHFIAFGFGSGLLPTMPGTYGTLAAIPIYLLCKDLSPISYLIVTLLISVFGMWLSEKVEREIGIHDYPGMNFDEIVGLMATLFMAPSGWFWVVLGFVLFRVFDIWKPGPIRWIDEHVHGGFGVVLDDLVAALFAWLTLQVTAFALGQSLLV